jgi:hypothetical protein
MLKLVAQFTGGTLNSALQSHVTISPDEFPLICALVGHHDIINYLKITSVCCTQNTGV